MKTPKEKAKEIRIKRIVSYIEAMAEDYCTHPDRVARLSGMMGEINLAVGKRMKERGNKKWES